MTDVDRRLDRIEEYVPVTCTRHDEQMKAICEFTKEIKGAVRWALRTTIGAVIVALAGALVTLILTGAMAGGR